MDIFYLLVIGLMAGMLAGFFGVGGGVIIVPILVYLFNYTQQSASGTSLVALLAPVGIGGVYAYYMSGKITGTHIRAGLWISFGMFFGTYLGSRCALLLSPTVLRKAFCIFLIGIAARMWLTSPRGA